MKPGARWATRGFGLGSCGAGAGAGCVLHGAAIGFSLAIPAGVAALTRIGAALYLNGDR